MEITNVLTLSDNKKYMIVSKTEYDGKIYLCLVDVDNSKNVQFGYLNNDEVVIIRKEDVNETLALKLLKEIGNVINNYV